MVRKTSILGGVALVIGSVMFVTLTKEMGPIWAAVGSFFIGTGMGLTLTVFIVSIQSTVNWQQRGIATASNMFMRNLGNTIGAALLGGILNSRLLQYFADHGAGETAKLDVDSINILLNKEERNNLPETMLKLLQDGLTTSLHTVYYVVLFIAIISLILILLLPKKQKSST